jgi:hypothetical protein
MSQQKPADPTSDVKVENERNTRGGRPAANDGTPSAALDGGGRTEGR